MNINTRALYRAVTISELDAPYNTAMLKVYYPANYQDSFEERNTGVVPVDKSQAPFPVVVLLPGINLNPEAYGWLAQQLSAQGIVTITYTLIAEEMPGYVSLTPGIDLAQLAPDDYGKAPSCITLKHIINEIHALNKDSVLAGALAQDQLILGGHSAGGTMSLLNANPDWFPEVSACFSYAAHSGSSTALGWPAETILDLPSKVPTLILGGANDGVIAASAHRYGSNNNSATSSLLRTFNEGINSSDNTSYLIILDGANHYSMAYPKDTTTGRPFIDQDLTRPDEEIRQTMAELLIQFINAHVVGNAASQQQLQQLIANPPASIAHCGCK